MIITPKELDSQYYGFKRMSKITGRPFNDVMIGWFKKYKDVHKMNDDEVKLTIKKILDYKTNL